MTTFDRGDIVLVLFPNSDTQTAKKRPALVVQANDLKTGLPQVVVAMITSNMARGNHKSRVNVYLNSAEIARTGLQLDSVIVTDNLATVQTSFIHRVLGRYAVMSRVEDALAHTLGLELR